jgi:hypothetical protein
VSPCVVSGDAAILAGRRLEELLVDPARHGQNRIRVKLFWQAYPVSKPYQYATVLAS